jgi:mRNA-degrading endonuclease RelE of RelBE toxin-antitoxin system
MIVKFRKAFFTDLKKIKDVRIVEEIEFIVDKAHNCSDPVDIPGLKFLRQYPEMARIEVAPYRIGVEILENTVIFKRVLLRSYFYLQFP